MFGDRIRRVEGGREVVRGMVKEGYLAPCTCRDLGYMHSTASGVNTLWQKKKLKPTRIDLLTELFSFSPMNRQGKTI